MDRFSVVDGKLCFGAVVVGPSTALYAAPGEFKSLTERDGVVHTTTTGLIDLVFVAGNKVVGVELKRGSDLSSSAATHKLARQLGTIGQTCDMVVLGLSQQEGLPTEVEHDLVSYQMMGTILVNLPMSQRRQVKELAELRPILGGTRAVLSAFVWTDVDLRPRREKKGWFLQSIPGVGDKITARLLERFGSVGVALNASDEEWAQLKIPKRVLDARRGAMQ